MARLAAAFIICVVLSACDVRDTKVPVAEAQSPTRALFSPSSPTALRFSILTTPLLNGARITGDTNLPDGTALMIGLRRGPTGSDSKIAVVNGRFSTDLFPNDGKLIPPGDYEVSVSTPLGDLQSDAVKAELGSNYEAVTGPLIRRGQFGGNLIRYESNVRLGGPPNAAADNAGKQQAFRDHIEFSKKSCTSNPAIVERLTNSQMSDQRKDASITRCLKGMDQSRSELVREGLLLP